MALLSGTRLGPYEVVSPLGAGGMGEVYRARDTRLDRIVAIKILPEALASDSDRLQRFRQEARVLSALSHPNLLAIYDVGAQNGVHYLVSEFLEGQTLRTRIDGGVLPQRKVLEYTLQLANGLAAAHNKGFVHRDLKPDNIFITRDERVKILDFGLAKQERMADAVGDSATLTSPTPTAAGTVLGTVGYMSPEQVRGQATDHRSDLFSFGAILYEMVSGKRAFHSESSVETMSAILKEDPPELTGVTVSPGLERIIRRCLEKTPERRFQSASDLAFAIESLSGASTRSTATLTPAKSPYRKWLLPVAAALVLLTLGLAGGGFFGRKRESIAPPTFQQLTFNRGILHSARFDPEDKNVIYSASWDGQTQQLYSTRPDSPESRALDLKNSQLLAVSPSSELAISLGCKYLFATECEGTLARVPVSGGAPREVLDDVNSADWATDGSGLAVTRQVAGKFRVEFPVGKVVYENAGGWLRSVRISPRGDDIAFMECPVRGGDAGSVVVLDKSGNLKTRTEFFPSLQGLAWSPTGDEVWFGATRNQNEANEVHGVTLSGKDRIVLRAPGIIRLHDVSRDGRILISRENWRGTMLFRGARDMKERDLSWLDYSYAADISRDGENLVFFEWGAVAGSDALAYERKRDGSPPIKLGAGAFPALSPDGKWVVAITPPSVTDRIFLLPTGSGEARNFDPYTIKRYASPGWMPDGMQIIFSGNDGREWRIYTQDLTGGRPRPVTPPVVTDAERFAGNLVSGDGKYVFARDLEGKPWRYPVGGGDPQPVPGIERDDSWIGWSSDNRFAYIFHWGEAPTSVFRLDLTTGRKQFVVELAPGDLTGVSVILTARITPDGKSYAYTLERVFSELYLVSGVK